MTADELDGIERRVIRCVTPEMALRLVAIEMKDLIAALRAVTQERDALKLQAKAMGEFCDEAIKERDALRARVAEMEGKGLPNCPNCGHLSWSCRHCGHWTMPG
jgi:Mg2+ and Co2+ transporters